MGNTIARLRILAGISPAENSYWSFLIFKEHKKSKIKSFLIFLFIYTGLYAGKKYGFFEKKRKLFRREN